MLSSKHRDAQVLKVGCVIEAMMATCWVRRKERRVSAPFQADSCEGHASHAIHTLNPVRRVSQTLLSFNVAEDRPVAAPLSSTRIVLDSAYMQIGRMILPVRNELFECTVDDSLLESRLSPSPTAHKPATHS